MRKSQSLADSDLAALNAALQAVVTERIRAQDLWEQANQQQGTWITSNFRRQRY